MICAYCKTMRKKGQLWRNGCHFNCSFKLGGGHEANQSNHPPPQLK